jgi:hypothetical protein
MKFATMAKGLIFGLALMLATSAFAETKGNLTLHHAVTLNGVTLPAGDYKVRWEGGGPEVQLSFMRGRKVLATTQARLSNLDYPAADDADVVQVSDSGERALIGVRFKGNSLAMDILESGQNGQSMAAMK